ncbi:triacylglycerol lipase [Maricurvus nonylphenolicus]|uniref:lipase family alpha/beta hydrolase n=1 Tax=Maricurvus nonylphenolicus TaxID=1008307 RepID=UPI0036F44B56
MKQTLKLVGSILLLKLSLIAPHSQALFFDYTETKHPIVLVPGIFGFDSIGGVFDYYHDVIYQLERSGAEVYMASSVTAVNSGEVHGLELSNWIQANIPPGEKVNLFAHSQGVQAARVAASLIPDRIASITSITGVNKGGIGGDFASTFIQEGNLIDQFGTAMGNFIDWLSGNEVGSADGYAGFYALTPEGNAELNVNHGWGVDQVNACGTGPEDVDVYGHNVKTFSWVGTSKITNNFDPSDVLFGLTGLLFPGEHDGLVPRCSQLMGNVIYDDMKMNHMDAANQALGFTSIWLDPIYLYRGHANRLKRRGL